MTVAALAVDAGAVDMNLFIQYGALGIFAFLLVLFAKGTLQRERDRTDRLEAENTRLRDGIQDKVIPALTSATKAVDEATGLLAAIQQERAARAIVERELRLARGEITP